MWRGAFERGIDGAQAFCGPQETRVEACKLREPRSGALPRKP